jgi:uncharacterized protein (TIGR03086 family)
MKTSDFDWHALQHKAQQEFATRIAAVTDWDAPTPDTEWSVRDLVAHVVEEQQWVPQLLAGRSIEQAKTHIEPLREDLAGEWALYSFAAAAAWHNADPSASVQLSSDTVTVEDYLREQVADITIHSWDLARAAGADERLDPELVQAVWCVFEPQQESLAATGLYASRVQVSDDADLQTRLLAVTGRDVNARLAA